MGAGSATLLGKAEPCDLTLLPFTDWGPKEIAEMRTRHCTSLGGCFAMRLRQFEVLLGLKHVFSSSDIAESMKKTARLFAVYDTDQNQLVDSYEVMASIAMLARLTIQQKVDLAYSLYDFNGTGRVTLDELILMLRTVAVGCQKVDARVEVPSNTWFEKLASAAFASNQRPLDQELSKWELDQWLLGHQKVRQVLDFFSGAINEVALGHSEAFCDSDYPCDASCLYEMLDHTPKGSPPALTVQWKRPHEFSSSMTPVLFGAGGGHLVAGLGEHALHRALGLVLASRPQLVKRLFLATRQEHHGRYCVQLHKQGNWTLVFLDDRVPCNALGQPLACRSSEPGEIWPMLVEKAYAKLHRNLERAARGCSTAAALRDLTGCATEVIPARKLEDAALWPTLQGWVHAGIVGMAATHEGRSMAERHGIVYGDTYSVLQTKERRGLRLVQVMNVLGRGCLRGTVWDVGGEAWASYGDVAQELKLQELPTHICWIEYSQLPSLFDTIYIAWVQQGPGWRTALRSGQWVEQGGGCFNHSTWPQTQQVFVKVNDAAVDLTVVLTQRDAQYHGSEAAEPQQHLGLAFVQHDFDEESLQAGSIKANLRRARKTHIRAMTLTLRKERDIVLHVLQVPRGKYVVVPMTLGSHVSGPYWLCLNYNADNVEVTQGPPTVTQEDLDAMTQGTAAEIEHEMSADGPAAALEDVQPRNGLAALARIVTELWTIARELEQRKVILEHAIRVAIS